MKAILDTDHTLEWSYGRTRVLVTFMATRFQTVVEVKCYPGTDKTSFQGREIKVSALISENHITIEDLNGNGYSSEFQNQGFGTLVVNVLILNIQEYLFRQGYDYHDRRWVVRAEISTVGDPDEEPQKTQCRERRVHFWHRFGLTLAEDKGEGRSECLLRDTRVVGPRSKRVTSSGAPICPLPSEFWPVGQLPELFPGTSESLREVNLDDLSIQGLPKRDVLKASEFGQQRYWTRFNAGLNVLAASAILTISIWAYHWQGEEADFGKISAAAFILYLACFWGANRLTSGLHNSNRKWLKIQEDLENLNKQMAEVSKAINSIEENCGGLMWRVVHWYDRLLPERIRPGWRDLAKQSKLGGPIKGDQQIKTWLECISDGKLFLAGSRH